MNTEKYKSGMKVLVREESPEDTGNISDLLNTCYGTEEKASLVEKLRSSSSYIPGLALVAEHENHVIGHILIIKIRIMEGENLLFNSCFLATLATHPDFRNNGIAKDLLDKAMLQATTLGYKTLVTSGPPDLLLKSGFSLAEEYGITPPYDVAGEELMALELVKDGFASISGILCYPEEFYSA